MPMERPNILDCNGVGKHRPVAIELKLTGDCDNDKCEGPAQARCDDHASEQGVLLTQRHIAHLSDCLFW